MKRITLIHGFTLLEVLTALAIIALLISVMMPALSMVHRAAQGVKQKGQFNTIEMGLEAFRGDGYDYPPSAYTRNGDNFPNGVGPDGYCGAQKLAEALVGMDGFGFHPKSQWRSDGLGDINGDGVLDPLYSGAAGYAATYPTDADKIKNYKARQGPYLEMDNSNAVKFNSMYSAGVSLGRIEENTYVVCDMYSRKNTITNKKIGMPILYFRADTSQSQMIPTPLPAGAFSFPFNTGTNAIYNVNDNFIFYQIDPHWGPADHPMDNSRMPFYNRIANPNFPNPARPYRSQSFILLSAGADGLYGSQDDVYNINEDEK